MTPDVVVAGNGIIGAAVALRLAAAGLRVVSVDVAQPAGSATGASGAMLGVLGEVTPAERPGDLALRVSAWRRHPAWRDEIGLPAPAAGTFVVAGAGRPDDQAAVRVMEAAAAEHGLSAQPVEPESVAELAAAPGHRPDRVLFLADEAWVDGPALHRAVIEAGARHGVTAVPDSVEAVVHAAGSVTGVLLRAGGILSCGEVVLCTGADVPALLAASRLDAGLVPPVVAAKGVGLRLEGQRGPVYRHVLRTPNRQFACGLHVVPRGEHGVYIGATNRAGSRLPGVSGRVTAGETRQLLTDVTRELAGPLDEWDITGLLHGRRPMPLDGLPAAGRTGLTGLSVATGTYRNGVLLAPLIADAVYADLNGAGPPGLSPRRPAPDVDTVAVLRQGLGELIDHWRYDSGARWHERLSPLIDELAVMALGDGPAVAAKRQRAAALVQSHGRPELIPETVIELLQTVKE